MYSAANIIGVLIAAVAVVILVMLLSVSVSMGFAYLLTLFLPLTLFQAGIITILSTVGAGLVLTLMVLSSRVLQFINQQAEFFENDEEDYPEDYDDEEDDQWEMADPRFRVIRSSGPEDDGEVPCPCGSGKKFKNCCGK